MARENPREHRRGDRRRRGGGDTGNNGDDSVPRNEQGGYYVDDDGGGTRGGRGRGGRGSGSGGRGGLPVDGSHGIEAGGPAAMEQQHQQSIGGAGGFDPDDYTDPMYASVGHSIGNGSRPPYGAEQPTHPGGGGGGGIDGTFDASSSSVGQYTASTARDRELAGLQQLCDAATSSDPESWERIRSWLRSHSADDARAAAELRGDFDTTPLHLACRNCPPADVVGMLLTAGPDTAGWADSFGWRPLHYACANEAPYDVLAALVASSPDSRTAFDKRKRTPLHFALGHAERPAAAETVALLGGTGAPLMADENGMLPLHYACAYGATEDVLRILIDNNIQTITATDNRGRTPLHFALGNADRPASPRVVSILLSQNPMIVNAIDLDGNLPIHLLVTRTLAIKADEKEKCANCRECLGLYLDANPTATADLLTALQSLPDWLRDEAVLSPVVQKILNIKIAQRFPTAVTLMDFVFYILVIAFFQVSVIDTLEERADRELVDMNLMPKENVRFMNKFYLIPLYLAVFYFTVREVAQALSLASLGLFNTWLTDLENLADCLYIFLILFWSIVMTVEGGLSTDVVHVFAAISMGVFWAMVLSFLQSIIVGFAVFVGGVKYVTKRLAAFLCALVIILIMFSQLFFTLYQMDLVECPHGQNRKSYTVSPVFVAECTNTSFPESCEGPVEVDCEPINTGPFCTYWTSFLKVFTMLLGEVDEGDFRGNKLATFLFGMFMFGCVIVLANVLIAIVTDSYSVIQNERAALVFWSNRLDFVTEMDVISNNLFRRSNNDGDSYSALATEDTNMRELWNKVMYLFDDDVDEHNGLFEFFLSNFLRFCIAGLLIPLWIILGFFTFGMLWPPQIREKLLTSQMAGVRKEASAERSRLNQVTRLREEVSSFKEEVRDEIGRGRDEMGVIKAILEASRSEIHAEMDSVKEIVTDLFELLSAP